jgi:hypothetical protein
MNIKNRLKYEAGLIGESDFRMNEENIDTKEIKLLEMQSRLLKAFQEFSGNLKGFKWDFDSLARQPYNGEEKKPETALKEMIEIKKKLASIAKDKMEVLNRLIDIIFGEPGSEEKEDEDDEDEEDDDEDEDDDEGGDEDWGD